MIEAGITFVKFRGLKHFSTFLFHVKVHEQWVHSPRGRVLNLICIVGGELINFVIPAETVLSCAKKKEHTLSKQITDMVHT